MKKSLAFLLMLCLCFMCFATVGIGGQAVHAEEGDDAPMFYVDARTMTQSYDAKKKQLTVEFDVGTSDGMNVKGGELRIRCTTGAEISSVNVTGTLFGVKQSKVLSSISSISLSVDDAASNSRDGSGSIKLVFQVVQFYEFFANSRRVMLSFDGSYFKRGSSSYGVDDQMGTLDAYICTHDKFEYVTTRAASCKESGWMTYRCMDCGMAHPDENETLRTGGKVIPAKGHTFDYEHPTLVDLVGYRAASCTELGFGRFRCTVCDKYETTTIPMIEHTYGARYLEGNVWKQKCSKCGKVQEAGNQCTHPVENYVLNRTEKKSTCTEAGIGIFRCPVCTTISEEKRALPLESHTISSWTTVTAATCSAKGSEKGTCSVCGNNSTRETEKVAHVFGSWRTTVAATCVQDGERSRTCANCTETENEVLAKTGHTFGAWEVVKDATCAAKGTRQRSCANCDAKENEDIDLSEHTYGKWTVEIAPTCTAEGTEKRVCSVCEKSESRMVAVNPEAHKYSDWKVIAAKNCTTDGEKERTCEYCSHVDRTVDESVGHVFGEPVTKKKVTTRVCGVCGYSEAKKVGKNNVVEELTLSCNSGFLNIRGALASKDILFELEGMSIEDEKYYRDNDIPFDKAYVFKITADGKPVELTADMAMTISMDPAMDKSDVAVSARRGQEIVGIGKTERKKLDLTIEGAELVGAEAVFLRKSEGGSSPNIIFPIVIAVTTLAIAGGVVYVIMSRSKHRDEIF